MNIIRLFRYLPNIIAEMIRGKRASWYASSRLRQNKRNLEWKEACVHTIEKQIERMIGEGTRYNKMNPKQSSSSAEQTLNDEELIIVNEIHRQTSIHNASNITRTNAYLECYMAYPELHWAFLAHMVSRNAGWNMTDLQGGLLHSLMKEQYRQNMYRFLERCNALIFQDAYPQLLLYMKSKELGKSLFHLLPSFHISRFMRPFWERFWLDRSSPLLSTALIINEQNYIERRVVRHPFFIQNVFHQMDFKVHEWVQLNQVIFPISLSASSDNSKNTNFLPETSLTGLVLEHFANVDERIEFGKTLYAMLFGYQDVLDGAVSFAASTPHRGSRADYWPGLFTTERKEALTTPNELSELLKQEWLPSGQKIYSPILQKVWSDIPYEAISRFDWLQDSKVLRHLGRPKRPFLFEMSHEHRLAIEKIALAHDTIAQITS
ncbi:DUF2515 domain-containing protein [Paenibacillus sediminis]|uniref:DUF2515 domain-containing protein n=1 Tax=Paenibacillus sediminis TaxID=664909 RepID=A0ABS4H5W8_9BACL|nr:DUF2515 family protein [Paenibacillus sediminis]MBP1937938.1 hypothetical protein [Paenibacillus sediminis]